MKSANNIILKLLGILLITAAALKGWQLLTEPMPENSFWSSRPVLIGLVELELALGFWLLSGLFKRAAWLTASVCFGIFSAVTAYKALTGAQSCGCFGSMQVNPWLTLFVVDLPAVVALVIFRPNGDHRLFAPIPLMYRIAGVCGFAAVLLCVSTAVLALNEPGKVTASYEVLEPESWVGKRLPIIDQIDIGWQLEEGNWLILLYHHDCPDCRDAIPKYEQIARDLAGNENFLRIALIELPPYGNGTVIRNSPCNFGRLADVKEWFITTPAVALLNKARVRMAWEGEAPDLNELFQNLTSMNRQNGWFSYFELELPANNIQIFEKGGDG